MSVKHLIPSDPKPEFPPTPALRRRIMVYICSRSIRRCLIGLNLKEGRASYKLLDFTVFYLRGYDSEARFDFHLILVSEQSRRS